jgi:hypothetical protein
MPEYTHIKNLNAGDLIRNLKYINCMIKIYKEMDIIKAIH